MILLTSCNKNEDMGMFKFMMLANGGQNQEISNIVNVMLITGQSNAVGYALTSDLDSSDLQPFPNVMIWNDDTGVNEFQPLEVGVNNQQDPYPVGERHGMDIPLARKYYDHFTEPLYIIKYGWGGTAIQDHLDVNPNSVKWVYPIYWNLNVVPAINKLLTDGKRVRVWQYWDQGESNNGDQQFKDWFIEWQGLVRTNLKNINIPFFACETVTKVSVNNAYAEIALVSANKLKVIEAEGSTTIPTDSIHKDTAAMELIADRLIIQLLVVPPVELTEILDPV